MLSFELRNHKMTVFGQLGLSSLWFSVCSGSACRYVMRSDLSERLQSIHAIHHFSDDTSLHSHPEGTDTINKRIYCILHLPRHQQGCSGKYCSLYFTFMSEFIVLLWVAKHANSSKHTSVAFARGVVVTRRIIASWLAWRVVQSRNKCIKIHKVQWSVLVSQTRCSSMLKKHQQTWQSVSGQSWAAE